MKINAHFDAGNIEVIDAQHAHDIQLKIHPDHHSHFFQWFYFQVSGAKHLPCTFNILNAGEAAFPEGWGNYHAVISYDLQNWERIANTRYQDGVLTIQITPQFDTAFLAYFAPYSFERHQQLLCFAQQSALCQLTSLGFTPDHHELSLLTIGEPLPHKKKCWIIARQHPGETMAEWYMEGLIKRLLDTDDLSKQLLEKAVFYLIPNMNPDGSVRGHLRTNAHGVNLNREWQNPSLEKSPEVFWVRNQMETIGVDFFLDVHGDESLPFVFLVSREGDPSYSERINYLESQFKAQLKAVNPDFQDQEGYAVGQFGPETMTLASHFIGDAFDCLSMTLEMPFKDNKYLPDARWGWSSERSMQLGRNLLEPLAVVLNQLR